MNSPKLHKPSQAAKLLCMGRNQIYDLIKRKEIGVVVRGARFFVPESEIERLINRDFRPARRDYFRHRSSSSREGLSA